MGEERSGLCRKDWFESGAFIGAIGILFTSALGIYSASDMSYTVQAFWIIGAFLFAGLTWYSAAKINRKARLADYRLQQWHDQHDANMRTILSMQKEPLRADIVEAFTLADDLIRFLQTHGAMPPEPFSGNPIARAARMMGMQPAHFPDKILLEQYRAELGDRVSRLVPRLRALGAQLHHPDTYYSDPPDFMLGSRLQSIAVELRNAATNLAASTR